MAKQKIMLTFPNDLLSEPVIFTINQQFNLTTNIRRAKVTDEDGWMLLDMEGKPEDIEAGITWATPRGMRIERISNDK